MAGDMRERYIAAAAGLVVIFLSCVAVAFAYTHTTNGVGHGLEDEIFGNNSYPLGITSHSGGDWSTAEVRHYFPDGTYNVQCETAGYYDQWCIGTWGSLPCHKRYVGGTPGHMTRHWVRIGSSCSGQLHA